MEQQTGWTIGQLAKAAGVGVETIRYYQRRQLLALPGGADNGSFRRYPVSYAERIRFIKRAQELGFSLEEIRHLLELENSNDRAAIREVASERLQQVRQKLQDLLNMEQMLSGLIVACEGASGPTPCPIIQALAESSHCCR